MSFGIRNLIIASICYYQQNCYNASIGQSGGITTGLYNTVVGCFAGASLTTQQHNTAIGSYAIYGGRPFYATAIGYAAGYQDCAYDNTYIGWWAGYGSLSITAGQNTFVGMCAGYEVCGGSIYNTFVGFCAGAATASYLKSCNTIISPGVNNLTSGVLNTVIGASTSVGYSSSTRNLIISAGCTVTTLCPTVQIYANDSGFSLGNTSPAVAGIYVTGETVATTDITAYYSDRRLKENIIIIDCALDKVKNLNGITYTVNELGKKLGFENNEIQYGLLADEVEKVIPEAVAPAPFDVGEDRKSISGEDYLTVKYERIVPLLVEAIKELDKKVDALLIQSEKFANALN